MEFTKGEIDTIIFRNDLLNYFLQHSTVDQKSWIHNHGYSNMLSNHELDKKLQQFRYERSESCIINNPF